MSTRPRRPARVRRLAAALTRAALAAVAAAPASAAPLRDVALGDSY